MTPKQRPAAGERRGWTPCSIVAAACAAAILGGCDRELPLAETEPAPVGTAPQPVTPDRLPPGELLEGTDRVFDFPFPRDLRVNARFVDWASARGNAPFPALIDYVKRRVAVRHVEMVEGRVVFPAVKVKGGDGRLLRIELIEHEYDNELQVHDLTPAPAVPGLSEEERWKKAGMTETGKLIDQQNLE